MVFFCAERGGDTRAERDVLSLSVFKAFELAAFAIVLGLCDPILTHLLLSYFHLAISFCFIFAIVFDAIQVLLQKLLLLALFFILLVSLANDGRLHSAKKV